jgi:hypothetical protein
MGIHAWAAQQTWLCDSADCRPSSRDALPESARQITRSCNKPASMSRNKLAGYCALIWAQPVDINGSLVGTAVSDHDVFRFFSVDVRLDELDGLVWKTLPELRSQVVIVGSLILAKLARDRLVD